MTISPELEKKLGSLSRTAIEWFYRHHYDAETLIKNCDASALNSLIRASEMGERVAVELTHEREIKSDEMLSIINRLSDFQHQKEKEFFDGLEKCGCKFK